MTTEHPTMTGLLEVAGVTVYRCTNCSAIEGGSMQAGCCRNCGDIEAADEVILLDPRREADYLREHDVLRGPDGLLKEAIELQSQRSVFVGGQSATGKAVVLVPIPIPQAGESRVAPSLTDEERQSILDAPRGEPYEPPRKDVILFIPQDGE